ncbi:MAG: hypothetical protein V3U16_03900 [Candidatus Neomarinimicrobiota bacterium]
MKTNNKRLYVLLGILAVVVVVYLWSTGVIPSFFGSGEEADQVGRQLGVTAPGLTSIPESSALAGDTTIDLAQLRQVVKEFRFDGTWVRDPFYYFNSDSLEKALLGLSSLRLTGVSLRAGMDFTLINFIMYNDVDTLETASILKEGDLIGSFTVETIAFDHVILRQGARRMRLTLYEE